MGTCGYGETLRVLAADLETSPNLADVWSLWNQNVGLSQLHEPTRVICWGARWIDEPARSVKVMTEFHDGHEEMIQGAHALLDEADALLTWNGKSFDAKHLNREFLEAGLGPPSPYAHIDLMVEVKKVFRFASNKLDHVSRRLGLSGKVQHEGHSLWVKCLQGDENAWKRMVRYQKQDVNLLVDLHEKLLPWLSSYPHQGLYSGELDSCQRCGGLDLERRGYAYTALGRYQQYRCRICGGWSRSVKREDGVTSRSV